MFLVHRIVAGLVGTEDARGREAGAIPPFRLVLHVYLVERGTGKMVRMGGPVAATEPTKAILAILTATDHQEAAAIFLDGHVALGTVFGVAEDPCGGCLVTLPLLAEVPLLHHIAGGGRVSGEIAVETELMATGAGAGATVLPEHGVADDEVTVLIGTESDV